MNVLQVTNGLSKSISSGGVEVVVRHIQEALKNSECNSRVFSTCDLHDIPSEYKSDSYKIIPSRRVFKNKSWSRFSFKTLTCLIFGVFKTDLVHIHLCKDFLTVTTVVISKIFKKPLILQTHGMISDSSTRTGSFFNIFLKIIVSDTPLLCLTKSEKEELNNLGFLGNKFLITNPMFIQKSVRFRNLEKRFDMVFLSRFHIRKRPNFVVEATEILLKKYPDVSVLMAGPDDGCFLETLEMVRDRRLDKSIIFPGPLGRKDVDSALSQARCFVLPSYGEIFPMAALEAAAASTPVILGSDCPLAIELASYGGALLADTPEELARCVTSIREDDYLASVLTQKAHTWVTENCSYGVYQEKLIRIYRSLIQRPES